MHWMEAQLPTLQRPVQWEILFHQHSAGDSKWLTTVRDRSQYVRRKIVQSYQPAEDLRLLPD
jgi:hypothetical protein